jgi:hypothetical protein
MVRPGLRGWVVVLAAGALLGGGCRRRPALCPSGTSPIPGRSSDTAVWCQGFDAGRTFWVGLYPGGQHPRQACPFTGGRLEGPYEAWHPSGHQSLTGRYVRGHRHGPWRQLDDAGKKVAEGEYRDGQLVRGAPVGVAATCDSVTP